MPRQFGNPITRGIYDVLIKVVVVVVGDNWTKHPHKLILAAGARTLPAAVDNYDNFTSK